MTPNEHNSEVSERQAHAEATYERLFGPRDSSAPDNDPELMEILRRFIFGDVFDTGVLDDQTRELRDRAADRHGAGMPADFAAAEGPHGRSAQRRRPTNPDPRGHLPTGALH